MNHHITPDQQQQAVSEWGRPGSYRCCVCRIESTILGDVVHTPSGFGMAACRGCVARMRTDEPFRRKALRKADDAAVRTTLQRLADLSGVTGAALLDAIKANNALHLPLVGPHLDARLGVPDGTTAGAYAQVMKVGQPQ